MACGVIETIPELWVEVEVEGEAGVARGRGNVLLSDTWAWPGPPGTRAERVLQMESFAGEVLQNATTNCGTMLHPLQQGWNLYEKAHNSGLPALAACLCTSPLDAAIHDAAGRLAGCSAFELATEHVVIPQLSDWFPGGCPTKALAELLAPPLPALSAWWVLSASDSPGEAAAKATQEHGIRSFKIKLGARDPEEDAKVFVRVFSGISEVVALPRFSIDLNESCLTQDALYQFVHNVSSLSVDALHSVDYIEQPTPRWREDNTPWDSHTLGIPLVLDEGLTSLQSVRLAKIANWNGIALKTCKGHTFALLAAALARQEGLQLYMQDLTNIKEAAVHSFGFASRINPVNGIELNSPIYLPSGNGAWAEAYPDLFLPREGKHRLDQAGWVGLGALEIRSLG